MRREVNRCRSFYTEAFAPSTGAGVNVDSGPRYRQLLGEETDQFTVCCSVNGRCRDADFDCIAVYTNPGRPGSLGLNKDRKQDTTLPVFHK